MPAGLTPASNCLFRRTTQDGKIDIVLGKTLRVLGHAELFEPVRYLLHRWPSRADYRLTGFLDLGDRQYAAIGTVSNVASRLCDEAKPGQIIISPRVLTKVENAVKVEPVGEFALKGIRRPLAAYNVVAQAE
jgi:hypothetical protein